MTLTRMRLTFLALAMVVALPADARSPYAGRYRVAEGPDTAGGLELRADGRFVYGLSEGALDEHAEGKWSDQGGTIRLTTEPKPTPPEFTRGADRAGADAPTILTTFPDGREIGGIDFRFGLGDGSVIAGYTQYYGWTFAPGDVQPIRWVELAEPIHGVSSPRFAIDPPASGGLVFVIAPNDIGTVDFDSAELERRGDDFVLHRGDRELRLVREKR
jgi:hypothetical protein